LKLQGELWLPVATGSAAMLSEDKIRCVLVHNHLLLRQGLRRLLEDQPDIEIIAEAGDAVEARQRIFEQRPDVVISDTKVFERPLDKIQQLVSQNSPETGMVFLGTEENQGAAVPIEGNFVAPDASADELAQVVRRVCATKAAGAKPSPEAWPPTAAVPRRRPLTSREREVLALLAEGRTVRSAAGILGLSVKTVDAHKFNLMRKLGVHNKAELVMLAIQKRLVKLPANFSA
jgi:two-component system response regulator NreC